MDNLDSNEKIESLTKRINYLEGSIAKLLDLLGSTSGSVNEDYLKVGEELRVELARYASH